MSGRQQPVIEAQDYMSAADMTSCRQAGKAAMMDDMSRDALRIAKLQTSKIKYHPCLPMRQELSIINGMVPICILRGK